MSLNLPPVFESLKIYCIQFEIPPLSSSPRGQTPNQNVKEPVSVCHYAIKWFKFELEAAAVFCLRNQNKNLCWFWFSPLCLDWMHDFQVSASKQIFNICQRPELYKQVKLARYRYGLIQQKTMMIFFLFFLRKLAFDILCKLSPEETAWSGSTLFAIPLCSLWNKCMKSKIPYNLFITRLVITRFWI